MKRELEKSLKRYLKRKVRITLGFVTAFAIMGNVGLDLGRTQMAQEIALRLFQSGNSPEQIAQLTGIDVEIVKQWIEEAK